jgi:hypothetical protein
LFPATGKTLQLTPPTVILKPVDKKTTGALTMDGHGVAVGILHTGRHYPDDLSEDGPISGRWLTTNKVGGDDAGVKIMVDRRAKGAMLFPATIIPDPDAASCPPIPPDMVEDFFAGAMQMVTRSSSTSGLMKAWLAGAAATAHGIGSADPAGVQSGEQTARALVPETDA